jgi:hypothetical protein
MSGTIIKFPSSEGAKMYSGAEERSAELKQNREGVVQKVRTLAESPTRKFDSREDRMWPAQEIARLIIENNIKPRQIHKTLGKKHRKKLHLDRLKLNPSVSPSEAKRKAAKGLDLKIQPYVDVLDSLADLLGRSRDEVVFNAFRETTISRSAAPSDDDRVEELNWLLQEMTRGIIRAEKLSDYFDQLYKTALVYDPILDEFFPSKRPLPREGYLGEGFDGDQWPCLEAPPWFPGVSILRLEIASFSGPLFVESELVAPNDCSQAEAARLTSPLRPNPAHGFGPGHGRDGEVSLYKDIRLVIGPRTSAGDLGPLFELRSFIQLTTNGKNRPLTFPFSVGPLAATEDNELNDVVGSVAARFDDGWHRVGGFGKPGWKGTMEVPEYWGAIENLYLGEPLLGKAGGSWEPLLQWTQVDVPTIHQMMEYFAEGHEGRVRGLDSGEVLTPHPARAHGQILFTAEGPYPRRTEFLYPACPELEIALSTGAIEKAIVEECQNINAKLVQRLEQAKTNRNAENAKQLTRWRNMGANNLD